MIQLTQNNALDNPKGHSKIRIFFDRLMTYFGTFVRYVEYKYVKKFVLSGKGRMIWHELKKYRLLKIIVFGSIAYYIYFVIIIMINHLLRSRLKFEH